MIEQQNTPIERLNTRVEYQAEIQRLKAWMKLIKLHTLDGSILAIIDMAIEGALPSSNEYKHDESSEPFSDNRRGDDDFFNNITLPRTSLYRT